MTAEDRDLRARLVRLARHAPTSGGGDTLQRALAVNRSRRLRAARWVAAAVAVVVLGTAGTLARPEAAPAVQAAQPTPAGPPPPEVYEQPPRGSLADDPGFLAGVAALRWSPPASGSGFSRSFDGDSRRVVYAADVPGGHRWAVVMARNGSSWVVNWFAGPRGARPAEMTEAYGPTGWSRSLPLALMDVSAATGPLVVLADPGVGVEYSATLDRAPDGSLVRDFVELPEVDGVRSGLVRTPVSYGPDTAPELVQVRNGVRTPLGITLTTGTPLWAPTAYPDDPPDPSDIAECLTANGFTVQAAPPSAGVYYEDPRTGDLSSEEQAERDRAGQDCFLGTGQD
ncbi:hypothetical protein [Modestobacter sp. SSW1-42]|uniref:hypothetical protein n=1 Tax=Modestobacter sp. SSW1-42 TaxID=596372 RepID=UPI003987DB30